jgi:NAD(P)H-dependent nitrite reductase small subunit
VFNFSSRGKWYASQNMCPHKKAFVLSRGIIGSTRGTAGTALDDIPKVACPLHKKNFSLDDGSCISGEEYKIETFPVQIEGDEVMVELPPQHVLDGALAMENFCSSTECEASVV